MLPVAATEVDAVLIDGPYLTGRRRLFHSLLRSWTDESIIVSTRHIDDRIRQIHKQATDGSNGNPIVVDCVSTAHVDDLDETSGTRYAAGPGNLTDIGTTVTDVLESRRDDDLAVGVAALSPLVAYNSVQPVFKFTQTLVNQATSQGWPVAAVASSEMSDDPTDGALRQPFDAVIETRRGNPVEGTNGDTDPDTDDTKEPYFRVRSRQGVSDWQPISSV